MASDEPDTVEADDDAPAPRRLLGKVSADAAEGDETRMPFLEHLRELRIRLRNSAIALVGGMIIAYVFSRDLFVLTARPLIEAWKTQAASNPALADRSFYYNSLLEPFWTYFSVALWGGIFIASPVIFHQLWKFLAPGLYKRERRWGIMFAISSAFFFIAGALFCYFVVLPIVFEFLLGYANHNLADISHWLGLDYSLADTTALRPMLSMREYLDLTRKLMLAFGIVFEFPLVILFMSLAGLITHRSLIKFLRWAILLFFIIGAILTPTPDPFAQTAMSAAMVVLYAISIGLAYLVTRSRERKQAALEKEISGG